MTIDTSMQRKHPGWAQDPSTSAGCHVLAAGPIQMLPKNSDEPASIIKPHAPQGSQVSILRAPLDIFRLITPSRTTQLVLVPFNGTLFAFFNPGTQPPPCSRDAIMGEFNIPPRMPASGLRPSQNAGADITIAQGRG